VIAAALTYGAGAFIIIGATFSLIAAVGILRLPDLYTRMHAASKAGTVGSGLLLLAIALVAFDVAVILRALAGVLFLLLTAPVAAHLLARAAYSAGYRPAEITTINEMEVSEGPAKKK
jgi:multicomponent Na+:H+ antiporter subunit G